MITESDLLKECLNASHAVYGVSGDDPNSYISTIGGDSFYTQLSAIMVNGKPLRLSIPDLAFYGQAFLDGYGNIIIAFEGSYPFPDPQLGEQKADSVYGLQSRGTDVILAAGVKPPALYSAEQFAEQVYQEAHTYFPSAKIYVTGHSLGGAEAEAAAKYLRDFHQLDVGGATFGATGLPLNTIAGTGSLINYIDLGDPVGNYARDTFIHSYTGDHYGDVVFVDAVQQHFSGGIFNSNPSKFDVAVAAFAYHPLESYARQFFPDFSFANYVGVGGTSGAPPLQPAPFDFASYVATVAQSNPIPHTVTSYPVVTSLTETTIKTNGSIPLSSLFAASEQPAGSGHSVDHYTVFIVQGAGSLAIGNQSYSLGSIATNVSPSDFANARFRSGANAGTSEIAVVAFDDAGTSSIAADTTIDVMGVPDPIIVMASVNAPFNSNVQRSSFLSLPPAPSGLSISLVNFINTHSGPGQLTSGGLQLPEMLASGMPTSAKSGLRLDRWRAPTRSRCMRRTRTARRATMLI